MRSQLIDICGNCGANIYEGRPALYDDHAELHFCDGQCFREWADEAGAEKVVAFYRTMNVEEVVT